MPEWIAWLEDEVAREGSDIWFERPPEDLRPEGSHCPECGGDDLRPCTDILDVWFDASCSHLAVLEASEDLTWPAQLYLEAGDQHRGWFQVSLVNGMALRDRAPFETVLTHGLILDENSKKMSKSLGNVIPPSEILDEFGADILRLAYTSVDFTSDIPFSRERNLEPVAESYRRVRNTCRFLLGNLGDFDPDEHGVPLEELEPLDRHALSVLRSVAEDCLEDYRGYAFHKVVRRLVNYCTVELSSFYLDILKDRLYCESTEGRLRRSAQTVLHHQLSWILRLLLPLIPFTMEEVWEHAHRPEGSPSFAQLSRFPRADLLPEEAPGTATRWDKLRQVRETVLAALEQAREEQGIGKSLEATVTLTCGDDLHGLLEEESARLADFFIVSGVEIRNAEGSDLKVEVSEASGGKCERCWKFTVEEGSGEPLCARCRGVIEETSA